MYVVNVVATTENCLYIAAFNSQSSPVSSGSALACDFSSSCCWGNVKAPQDQLDYVTLKKAPSAALMQKGFGTSNQPSKSVVIRINNYT
jgi:hypothetical protein